MSETSTRDSVPSDPADLVTVDSPTDETPYNADVSASDDVPKVDPTEGTPKFETDPHELASIGTDHLLGELQMRDALPWNLLGTIKWDHPFVQRVTFINHEVLSGDLAKALNHPLPPPVTSDSWDQGRAEIWAHLLADVRKLVKAANQVENESQDSEDSTEPVGPVDLRANSVAVAAGVLASTMNQMTASLSVPGAAEDVLMLASWIATGEPELVEEVGEVQRPSTPQITFDELLRSASAPVSPSRPGRRPESTSEDEGDGIKSQSRRDSYLSLAATFDALGFNKMAEMLRNKSENL